MIELEFDGFFYLIPNIL